MLLEIRNKNVYSLGVGISTIFKIFSKLNFLGGWEIDHGVMTYISSNAS
jgi:hypothetical protein